MSSEAEVRSKTREFLSTSLSSSAPDLSSSQLDSLASELEQGIFDAAGGSIEDGGGGVDYRGQAREVGLTLKKNNPALGRRIAQGNVDAREVGGWSAEQLKSTEQAQKDAEMREEGLQSSIGVSNNLSTSGGTDAAFVPNEPVEGQGMVEDEGAVGRQSAMMGEEGDFKSRAQPRIPGLEGVEFETGV